MIKPIGLHALTIVGFDDSKNAFKLYNSWGATWGNAGYIWLDYNLIGTVLVDAFIGFTSFNKVKDITGDFVPESSDAGYWNQKADFPTPGSTASFQFTALNRIYIGGNSYNSTTYVSSNFISFYEPQSNKWTITNSTPKNFEKLGSTTKPFVIGTRAYFYSTNSYNSYPLMEYDVVNNTITNKAVFDKDYLWNFALSCSIGSKGYFGLGQISASASNPDPKSDTGPRRNQLWEYNPTSDTWTRKKDIPHNTLFSVEACEVINEQLYVVIWDFSDGLFTYMYDPVNDSWTVKARLISDIFVSNVSFVAQGKLYYGIGNILKASNNSTKWKTLYAYDPVLDKWTQVRSFPGSGSRSYLSGAVIANKAYVGLGATETSGTTKYLDWWEYKP